jgi:drug/metabolite transporter (DMT)-like permease
MLWFILSLASAFLMASEAAYLKKFFSGVSPWEMGVIPFFYASPLCLIVLLTMDAPPLADGFFPAMAWVLPMSGFAFLLHFRAVYLSPLSLTMPFLGFTPVFVILTGDILLGESINTPGTIGILLVVAGGYVLNLGSARYGLLGPIRAIFREPGSALMLLVAALYGLTAVGGKILILHSSPLFGPLLMFALLGPLFTIILAAARKISLKTITRRPVLGAGAGILLFVEILCHNFAISLVAAAYMVTIKRMAGIFSVLYGRYLFGEKDVFFRLLGTLIMTAGAAVIAFMG